MVQPVIQRKVLPLVMLTYQPNRHAKLLPNSASSVISALIAYIAEVSPITRGPLLFYHSFLS